MSLNPMLLRLLMISPLLLTAACGGAPEDKKEEPLRVTVVRAAPADMAQTLRLSGTLSAREDIAVSTPLQGLKIVAVYADAGDTVKRGQVLAQLEDVNADSQLRQTEAQLARAKAQLRSQQAAAAEAAATLKRYRPLAEADALSRQELDQQKSAAATAAANVEAAKADIAQLQAQLKDSRNQRGKTQIVAPADGVIAKRNAEAGALTGPDALFHIITNGTVELAADAGADELPLLQNGARAQVSVRGRNEAVGGTVRLVPPEIDSSTRAFRRPVYRHLRRSKHPPAFLSRRRSPARNGGFVRQRGQGFGAGGRRQRARVARGGNGGAQTGRHGGNRVGIEKRPRGGAPRFGVCERGRHRQSG